MFTAHKSNRKSSFQLFRALICFGFDFICMRNPWCHCCFHLIWIIDTKCQTKNNSIVDNFLLLKKKSSESKTVLILESCWNCICKLCVYFIKGSELTNFDFISVFFKQIQIFSLSYLYVALYFNKTLISVWIYCNHLQQHFLAFHFGLSFVF